MASFAISNVLITPFYSKIFNIIGKKRVFYIGLFIEVN